MTEQIENILAELKVIQAKLPELRDLFWLKIDRYNEADQQRGVAFDEKFEQQRDKLSRVIDSFSAFIEKSFAPSAEEVAREKALQKLRAEFPGFDDWNKEAKKALLEREMNDFLKTRSRISDNSIGFSKRKIKDELQNLTIFDGNNFSEDFLKFYDTLDPTPATHNFQKFTVRNYLLEQGIDKVLINSLKGNAPRQIISKKASLSLKVIFSDGTEIAGSKATQTFINTIKKIGIEKVVQLNLNTLVRTDTNFERTAQLVQIGNCYVNTHSSTITKKRFLDTISNRLNLNLKVEISEKQ
jgi:hypothetical protein